MIGVQDLVPATLLGVAASDPAALICNPSAGELLDPLTRVVVALVAMVIWKSFNPPNNPPPAPSALAANQGAR